MTKINGGNTPSTPPQMVFDFDSYRQKYSLRQPDLSKLRYKDELDLIGIGDGLSFFPPSMPVSMFGPVPKFRNDGKERKYLWSVSPSNVPFALENGANRNKLSRGYLSHTNLTGGLPAFSGGEMWFIDDNTVVINGGSSRYLPRGVEELADVSLAMKACGFKVGHMGWNFGTKRFARFKRGEPTWV